MSRARRFPLRNFTNPLDKKHRRNKVYGGKMKKSGKTPFFPKWTCSRTLLALSQALYRRWYGVGKALIKALAGH